MTKSLLNKLKVVRKKSNHEDHKHSAVILLKGRPVSWGFNSKRSDPKILKFSSVQLTHAELNAVVRAPNKSLLTKCSIIIYREDKLGNMANSRPCLACQKLLKSVGLINITYSTPSGFVKETLS